MSDNSAVATKEDIKMLIKANKMLFEANKQDIQMIMDAMKSTTTDLKEEINEVRKEMRAGFEESHRHTSILIEDLEDRLLGTNHDVIALHDDKLENQMLYAVS